MDPVTLAAVAVAAVVLTRKPKTGDEASTDESKPSGTYTFPPITDTPREKLFCAPWDTYGGWSDGSKVEEASKLYVNHWELSPSAEFLAAIEEREPCERRHIDAMIYAFPPFPGQTFKLDELKALKAKQQAERAIQKADDKAAKEKCMGRFSVGGKLLGAIAGGVGVGLATAGKGAIKGAELGAQAGSGGGFMLGTYFC